MADFFVATSEDGVRFKLKSDGTWEPDMAFASKENIHFRSSDWGDSLEQVKAVESDDPENLFDHEVGDWLAYETHFVGLPVICNFVFTNGMLIMGLYGFTQEHADNKKFIPDFELLQRFLTFKYGEPSRENDCYLNHKFEDDIGVQLLAVSCGAHSIFRIWEDKNTELTLKLVGENYAIQLIVIYKSKHL